MSNKPIPSDSIEDLKLNVLVEDEIVNNRNKEHVPDRFGVQRLTLWGMEKRHDRLMAGQGQRFDNFMAASGGEFSGFMFQSREEFQAFLASSGFSGWDREYGPGIVLNSHNEGFVRCEPDGSACLFFTPKSDTPLPYTTTGDWAAESALFTAQNGDTPLRQELASGSSGDRLLAAKSSIPGTVYRTQHEENSDIVSIRQWTGDSLVNGVDFLDGFISAAVAYCADNGLDIYWPHGTYAITGNIPRFWEVNHFGPGVIKRDGNIWFITPKRAHENKLFSAPSGVGVDYSVNDGLSPEFPVDMQKMNSIVQSLGDKSSNGVWGVRLLSGKYFDNGIRLAGWPVFKNPFRFWGQDSNASADIEPAAIWEYDGLNSNVYAVFAQDISAYLHIDFRYISFRGWVGPNPSSPASNAGGIVLWNQGQYSVDRCWFIQSSIGFSFRYGYAKVTNSRFEDNHTWGVSALYGATANFGTMGDGNKFIRSQVMAGRFAIVYLTDNDFDQCFICVLSQWKARINPVGNRFSNWGRCVYLFQGDGLHTGGDSNQYLTPATREKPIWISDVGSLHRNLHIGVAKTVQQYSNSVHSISGKQGQRLKLADEFGDFAYSPFRLPGWALYSDSWRLEVELRISLNNGSGGLIELTGQSNSTTAVLASATIPTQTGGGSGHQVIRMTVMPRGVLGAYGLVESRLLALGTNPTSVSTLPASTVSSDDDQKVFRLYFTPSSNEMVQFISMRSWFEG